MKSFDELKELVNSMEEDVTKFSEKGNKAAGTRVRKALMEIKNHVHEMRKEVVEANK